MTATATCTFLIAAEGPRCRCLYPGSARPSLRKAVILPNARTLPFRLRSAKAIGTNKKPIATLSPSQPEPGGQNKTENASIVPPRRTSLQFPTFIVWGANTGIGKTLVSCGVMAATASEHGPSCGVYLKPVQTGYPPDSDAEFVSRHAGIWADARTPSTPGASPEPPIVARQLYAWPQPLSPHLAAAQPGAPPPVDDATLVHAIQAVLEHVAGNRAALLGGQRKQGPASSSPASPLILIETAGGVASPGPSGSLQCDIYRGLRLPCVLVGDGRLGGISATITAYESLLLRGFDTVAVVVVDGGYQNHSFLAEYFQKSTFRPQCIISLPALPAPSQEGDEAGADALRDWYRRGSAQFRQLASTLREAHTRQLVEMDRAGKRAMDTFWWPFTQHQGMSEKQVMLIDSRFGDNLLVYRKGMPDQGRVGQGDGDGEDAEAADVAAEARGVFPLFDGCCSWWTQGMDVAHQHEMTKAVAYAAGRYGHVMFPENSTQAAQLLADKVLGDDGPGAGWARRVFFSDDGSTAVEVALKMAFRLHVVRRGHPLDGGDGLEDRVALLGLAGGYHGDTLGALDAQPQSVFAGFRAHPWYRERGLFLSPPTLACVDGQWRLLLPAEPEHGGMPGGEAHPASAGALRATAAQLGVDVNNLAWDSRDDALDVSTRLGSGLCAVYRTHIEHFLAACEEDGTELGAFMLEPLLQGAGGMYLVDPLFQRVAVDVCKQKGIPVIFDEVFVGVWRLGIATTSHLLGCTPDIGCYAKLLTGGLVPLALTLTTEEVFDAFKGDSKADALLHGHSYTAHAVGCHAAVAALTVYADPASNANLLPPGGSTREGHARMRELWDESLVRRISMLPSVSRTIALGTVFALELRTDSAGYTSTASKLLTQRLKQWRGVYTRPLGNVVYLMVTPLTEPARCQDLLQALLADLQSAPDKPSEDTPSDYAIP
eukprot:jgi/Mesvir1/28704/Mv19675-RA.1